MKIEEQISYKDIVAVRTRSKNRPIIMISYYHRTRATDEEIE